MRLLAILSLVLLPFTSVAQKYPLGPGDHVYQMPYGDGQTLPLWTHAPVNLSPQAPVFIVMHGASRDADRYLDEWRGLADEYGFFLLVPEFSKRLFPRSQHYNLGNVRDDKGQRNPSAQWSFTRVEEAFDFFREQAGIETNEYVLYGHSAGAQFVHRFLYFMEGARAVQYIAANAGWYTMPDFSENWPYGLRRTVITKPGLDAALARPLLILLGDRDNDPNHPSLRRTREAMRQGPHRLYRGATFFRTAQGQASVLKADFQWSAVVVEDVAHNNAGMAKAATGYLLVKP